MKRNEQLTSENMSNEMDIVKRVSEKWGCENTYIGKNLFSRIDGFFHIDNELKGIFEVRKKKHTLSWIQDYNSCLVSFNKLMLGAELSRILGVKFFYLIGTGDDKVLVYTITDKKGKIVCPMNIRYSENKKKSLNFEKQTNAYLSLDTEFLKII